VSVLSGVQQITVEFAPGYISIRSSSPYQAQVYVTRKAAIKLIRQMVPLARLWMKHPHRDHDVPKAMHEAYLFEQSILEEKRRLKKVQDRDLEAHQQAMRQKQRWLRARERAARKQT